MNNAVLETMHYFCILFKKGILRIFVLEWPNVNSAEFLVESIRFSFQAVFLQLLKKLFK